MFSTYRPIHHYLFTAPDMTTRVVKSLTQTSAHDTKASGISLIKLPKKATKTDIKTILSNINPKAMGKNFAVIVSYGLVGAIMEYAKDEGLVDIINQWMYIISDTEDKYHEIEMFDNLLKIGDNIAFIYNTTKSDESCTVSN